MSNPEKPRPPQQERRMEVPEGHLPEETIGVQLTPEQLEESGRRHEARIEADRRAREASVGVRDRIREHQASKRVGRVEPAMIMDRHQLLDDSLAQHDAGLTDTGEKRSLFKKFADWAGGARGKQEKGLLDSTREFVGSYVESHPEIARAVGSINTVKDARAALRVIQEYKAQRINE